MQNLGGQTKSIMVFSEMPYFTLNPFVLVNSMLGSGVHTLHYNTQIQFGFIFLILTQKQLYYYYYYYYYYFDPTGSQLVFKKVFVHYKMFVYLFSCVFICLDMDIFLVSVN